MSEMINLQTWYASQCDGDWEHSHGVKIETLDNPGWSLSVDTENTYLEHKNFEPVQIERATHDWIFCGIKGGVFEGAGGPDNLLEMISIFLNWASTTSDEGIS